jgi:hypothetical protein
MFLKILTLTKNLLSRLSDHDVIKTIGEKFTDLEYLELSLKTMKAEDAIAELKRYLPGLRGVIKEVQDRPDVHSGMHVPEIVKF